MVLPLAKQQEGLQERQVPDLLYVDDLVDLMLMAVQNSNRAVAQIYNGGGRPGNALSIWAEFRELLERTAGRVPSVGDIQKLRDHLSWALKVGVEEGVRQLIKQWYVELVAAAAR